MTIKIPIRLLNIEGDGFHLLIKIRINGKSASAIIDSGASKTVFDKKRIDHFLDKEKITEHDRLSTGLGTASMKSHEVTLKKFAIGKLEILDYKSVVLDLSHVNQTYSSIGIKPIDGVLGSDVMEKYNAIIDYGKKIMILTPPKRKTATKKGSSKQSKLSKKKVPKKK